MPPIPRAYSPCRRLSAHLAISRRCIRPSTITRCLVSDTIQNHSAYHTATPRLVVERSDGTLEDIPEEKLYRYTRNRWIYNESVQLSQRYLKFDLQQLLNAAVNAVSSEGARYCTRVLKCREGLNSKAYLLTMDNGSEVIAKLPNPIAGPAYYTTASEVATREFLRNVLNIPAPYVIAWSADRNNPVGAEYILEEKAPGKPLGSLWYQWPMRFRLEMISQIVEIERQLACFKFSKSGCIYFKGDVPDYAFGDNSLVTSPTLPSSVLEPFSLGPLVSSGMWRGDRADMGMKCGPYSGPREFVEAMATNEINSVKTHARPRMNYHRSSIDPELPDELLDLLEKYLKLTPAMVPTPKDGDTHSPTLWHPDLHLDNVFVDPESKKITRIIDWQSAAVMPFYYQSNIPKMFKHPRGVSYDSALPRLPDNYDNLDQNEKQKIDSDRKSKICHKYYEAETSIQNPRHWATLQLQNLDVRTEPSRLVVNAWEDRDVFFLRRALHSVVEQWQYLCPDSGKCPVKINKHEFEMHAAEEESMGNVSEILSLFLDNWGLPPDGMVDPNEFNQTRTAVAELRETFIENGDDEAQKELFSRLWPYQDTDR